MPDTTWSVQDAKAHFSAVIEAACHGQAQTVTKHGRPSVVIMAATEYERLRRLERLTVPSFVDHLLAMPADDEPFERIDSDLRETQF